MHYGLHSLSPRHLVVPRIPPGFIFQHLNITSNMVQHSQRRLFFQRPLFCKSESCISRRLQNEGGKLACELILFPSHHRPIHIWTTRIRIYPCDLPGGPETIGLKQWLDYLKYGMPPKILALHYPFICRFAGFVVLIVVSTRECVRKVSKHCRVACEH